MVPSVPEEKFGNLHRIPYSLMKGSVVLSQKCYDILNERDNLENRLWPIWYTDELQLRIVIADNGDPRRFPLVRKIFQRADGLLERSTANCEVKESAVVDSFDMSCPHHDRARIAEYGHIVGVLQGCPVT